MVTLWVYCLKFSFKCTSKSQSWAKLLIFSFFSSSSLGTPVPLVHQSNCLPPCLPCPAIHRIVYNVAHSLTSLWVPLTKSHMGKYLLPLLCSWAAEFCWRKFRPCSDPPKFVFYEISGDSVLTEKDFEWIQSLKQNCVLKTKNCQYLMFVYWHTSKSVPGPPFLSLYTLSLGSHSCQ